MLHSYITSLNIHQPRDTLIPPLTEEEAFTNLVYELKNTHTWSNLNENPTADPNLSHNVFIEILQSAKEKHIPSKLIRFKKYKHT